MTIKTFEGTTLEEARKEAERHHGDKFVILESREPSIGKPASVTVSVTGPSLNNTREQEETVNTTGSFFQPITKQIGRLFENGSARQNVSSPKHNTTANGAAVSSREGVSFVRSGTEQTPLPRTASDQEQENSGPAGASSFREHFRQKPDNGVIPVNSLNALNRRMELLERMVRNMTDTEPEKYSRHSLYQYLRKIQFRPELVMEWFEKFEQSGNQPDLTHDVLADVERYFKPSLPVSGSKAHLFSSFVGTRITEIVAAAASYLGTDDSKVHLGLLLSGAQGFNQSGNQIMDTLGNQGIQCTPIGAFHNWQNFSEQAGENDYVILITEPMPFSADIVEERWEHYNRLLGEYHSVKHHFAVHSLIDPVDIIDQLPSGHIFQPHYVALTNIEMCRTTLGRLSGYKEMLNTEFSFCHTGEAPDPFSYGAIEDNIAGKMVEHFHANAAK